MQASLDAWYNNCDFSQDLIKETSKNCSDLWDSTLDIIEYHDMPHVQFLGQAVPLSNCLTDVNQQKNSHAMESCNSILECGSNQRIHLQTDRVHKIN
jgi:hypothetical protein